MFFVDSVLISYFSVEVAYEGQVAKPTAAITMSKKGRGFYIVYELMLWF